MIDPKELEALQAKAGGGFALTTLFYRRLRELHRGLPPLADAPDHDFWESIAREILESKIALLTGEEAEELRKELEARAGEQKRELAHAE